MATKDNVQGVVLALFGASAGGHLAGLTAAATANGLTAVAGDLAASAGFILGKDLSTAAAFRDNMLTGLGITSTNSAYAAAAAWADGELAKAGANRGEIVASAVNYLAALTDTTSPFYAAATAYRTTVTAAVAWSEGAGATVFGVAALQAQQGTSGATGVTFVLASTADLPSLTSGNDVVNSTNTATTSTYNSSDILIAGDGTDTLNITASNVALGAATTVVGFETINVTATGSGITDASSFNAGGVVVAGSTLNVSNEQSVNSGSFTVTALGTGGTVAANANITGTLSVTTAAAAGQAVTLTANKAETQTLVLTGTAGTTDTATVSAAGTVGTDTAGTAQIETVNFSGNGAAATYTISGAATTYNLTGSQSVTLAGNESSFDGKTITDTTTAGTTTLKITTSADSDLSKAAVDVVELYADGNADTYTLRNGQYVNITKAVTTADVTFDINDQETAYTDGAITVDLGVAFTTGVGIAITATSATSDNISTLNLVNNTVAQTALEVLATADTAVSLSGSKAVVLETTSTAKSITQTGAGALTVNFDGTADVATVTGGSGADTFAFASGYTTGALTIDGGAGVDKITLAAGESLAAVKLSNIEVIDLTATGVTFNVDVNASQLSGKTYIVTGAGGDDVLEIDASNSVDTLSVDLSGLILDAANISVSVDATKISADFGASSPITFVGSIGADTLVGTNGADIITMGLGADTVTAGKGNDTIDLTETTAAIDTVVFSAAADNGVDTINGFVVANDIINVKALGNTVADETAIAANASTTDLTTKYVAVFANGADGTGDTAITDYTNMTQVVAFLAGSLTEAATETYVAVINDLLTNKAYVYDIIVDTVTTTAGTIEVGDVTLVGTITADAALTTSNTAFA